MAGNDAVAAIAPEAALDILRELGLTEYEAKCFLGLTKASSATASELSKICGVPRSRIYDVGDSLAERGLVEVEAGETKRYRAIPVEMAVNKFQREYQSRIAELEDHLQNLEPAESGGSDAGVWTVEGRKHVLDRAQAMIDAADEELFLMVEQEDLIVETCLHRIQAACRRGVRVIVATESPDVHELIEEHAPESTFVDPDADALGLPIQDGILGRIVMVDREAVLVATLGSHGTDGDPHVIGVWGSGPENGFVAVLSQLLGNWIDDSPYGIGG